MDRATTLRFTLLVALLATTLMPASADIVVSSRDFQVKSDSGVSWTSIDAFGRSRVIVDAVDSDAFSTNDISHSDAFSIGSSASSTNGSTSGIVSGRVSIQSTASSLVYRAQDMDATSQAVTTDRPPPTFSSAATTVSARERIFFRSDEDVPFFASLDYSDNNVNPLAISFGIAEFLSIFVPERSVFGLTEAGTSISGSLNANQLYTLNLSVRADSTISRGDSKALALGHGFATLSIGQAAIVPVPPALPLLLTSLAVLAITRARRSRNTTE